MKSAMRSLEGDVARLEADEEELYDDEPAGEEEEEDASCCGGTTCCNATLRNTSVNEPISSCLSQRITWSSFFWLATSLSMISMTWATLYFLIGDAMLPGGRFSGLFFLVIVSYALGWSLAYIPYLHLPPVFGMLLAGIIFRNSGLYDIQEKIGSLPTAKIRTFCLTFVTLRAGLQLNISPLRRHPLFLLALALIPCSIEMLVVGLCSRYLLDYPWDWAFLTGSIIACMSPVVTVNCILALADRGYGEDKGMATLLCTAASIDDVHIVSLYSICFSIVFSVGVSKKQNGDLVRERQPYRRLALGEEILTDVALWCFQILFRMENHSTYAMRTEWWAYIPGGFRDLLLGFIVGFVLGTFFVFFPHRTAKHVMWYRLGSLILASLTCTTAASTIAITGGGYLATVIMTFIATTGWRYSTAKFNVAPLRKAVYFIWHFMQPILVGVIGADIDFANWSAKRFGLYVSCILIGLLARSVCAILSTYGTSFNAKERMFVALAWLPKGTLQAALAPMAYEHARLENDPARIELALDIVRLSVVSIIFLAPLGAIIMMISGPLLLNKITDREARRQRYLSYLRTASQLQPVVTRIRRGRRRRESAEAQGQWQTVQENTV